MKSEVLQEVTVPNMQLLLVATEILQCPRTKGLDACGNAVSQAASMLGCKAEKKDSYLSLLVVEESSASR